ncbi:hypothetical protein EIL87_21415 [Saccharopolyspora rhizosphaerae]|uniref:Uncharacterized protein n=1 Tax=Saccharopolyspora rhizosphaerae TaxID=2492662 RepID=A0A3R8P177_9PSEU|nr:hypothetical protein [Saccharopolyspora rhizosphaerae]RRO14286.1 hypothetical protein EIL87_21415 [Saccharopolyspora rhizosphaerae]
MDAYRDRLATGPADDLPEVVQHDADHLANTPTEVIWSSTSTSRATWTPRARPVGAPHRRGRGRDRGHPVGHRHLRHRRRPGGLPAGRGADPRRQGLDWQQFGDTAAQITANTPDGVHGLQDIGFVDAGLVVFALQRGEQLDTPQGGLGVSDRTLAGWFRLIQRTRDQRAEP